MTVRNIGRQHLGALFNIIAYYILALPLGITLAFYSKLGLQGLWIGQCLNRSQAIMVILNYALHLGQVVGLFIVGIGEYFMVWLGTDWDLEIKKGIERNRETGQNRRVATASDN
jgi:MATE family multidrug resistance protein